MRSATALRTPSFDRRQIAGGDLGLEPGFLGGRESDGGRHAQSLARSAPARERVRMEPLDKPRFSLSHNIYFAT